MRSLQSVWGHTAKTSTPSNKKFENWAEDFIAQLTQFTGESADDYSSEISEGDNGMVDVFISSMYGDVEELSLTLDTTQNTVTIDALLIRNKGVGIGKYATLCLIDDLRRMGFQKFLLEADDMGPGFWPKLGFRVSLPDEQVRTDLQQEYAERLTAIEPYISKIHAAMVRIEVKNFDEDAPYRLSKLGFTGVVSQVIKDENFQRQCGMKGTVRPCDLPFAHQSLHYILKDIAEDPDGGYALKLGNLMSRGIKMNMEFDVANREQVAILESARASLIRQFPNRIPAP